MSILAILANIITIIFFLVVLSYYVLIFIKPKKKKFGKIGKSLTIIIPAYNEEPYIKDCLSAAINADFNGQKNIIVVDDGSRDKTILEIKKSIKENPGKCAVKLIKLKHNGKSNAINTALKYTQSELVAIVDADSIIAKDALIELAKVLSPKEYAGACGVIKLKNKKKFISLWVHIEQLYNSLIRMLFSKIHANIVTPGPLSMYKRKALEKINGFSTKGFSEDVDVTIRLIRKGYKIAFSEKSVTETNMPYTVKGFGKQRTRFAKGWLNIFKKHMQIGKTIIDIYSLPLMLFTYIQGVIMGIVTIYNITQGYILYFSSKGIIFSGEVLKYFLEWFSIAGVIRWVTNIINGNIELSFLVAISIIVTLISYPLYLVAIVKYEKKFTLWHLIPLLFMAPFWFVIMIIYIINIPEYFKKHQYNIWEKCN